MNSDNVYTTYCSNRVFGDELLHIAFSSIDYLVCWVIVDWFETIE